MTKKKNELPWQRCNNVLYFIIDHSMKVVEGRHRGLFPISMDPVEFRLLVNINPKIERTDLTTRL